jgi:protein-S-isoprenylcysteine O-methyltransferase Ste14
MHNPPVFTYPEAIFFWIIFIWIFSLEIRHSGIVAGAPSNIQDAGTLRIINIGGNIALFLAFALAFLPWLVIPHPRIALYIGTSLLVIGSLLRRYCFRILGKYLTAAVTVSPDQPIIEKGLYRWVRHPSYTAGFLVFLGIGFALGSWLGVGVFIIVTFFVYRLRVKAEEAAMLDTLGEPYRAYMTRTKRFIPFIF